MSYEEIEDFLVSLKIGDYVLIHDFLENEVYPVYSWQLDNYEAEIWYHLDEECLDCYSVEVGYPDDSFQLRLACEAERIFYGI